MKFDTVMDLAEPAALFLVKDAGLAGQGYFVLPQFLGHCLLLRFGAFQDRQ